jgi:flagellar motor switch protein FliM
MVESRFGGNGRFPISKAGEEFSAFEHKSMQRMIETTLAEFALACQPFSRLDTEIVRYETKPLFAAFAAPDDLIAVSAYDITIDHGSGRLLIALPCTSVEPMLGAASPDVAAASIDRDPRWREALQTSVIQASITLNVELAALEISVAELMVLAPGNIFEMPRPDTVIVEASGVPLFRGRWGRSGGKVAVSVEECLPRPADMVV